MNRIISKEEEREDPRRDSSIYLRVQNTVVFPHTIHSYKNYSVSTRNPATPSNSTYRINSSPRTTGSSRADHYKASSSNCSPCLQAFYTAELGSYSTPSAPYTSRLPVILPGRNSILHGSQHSRSPYSSSQASSTVLHYRILPGEIGFIPKGQVLYVHAILRSVCSNLLILVLE